MKRYQLEATLLSPVVVKEDRQSQRSVGVATLSGSVVRGALAALYLETHGEAGDEFRQLFLDESACRFGPLDPGPNTLPATAVSRKRHPGFLADRDLEQKTENRPHGVADQLWSRMASRLAGTHLRGAGVGSHCRKCPHDLKPLGGFWEESKHGPRKPGEMNQRLNMHVGIDRATHTAAEAMLYSLQALDPIGEDSKLFGWLDADDSARARLEVLLRHNDGEIRAGHARTRGYGRVRLRLLPPPAPASAGWDRWSDGFNRLLKQLRREQPSAPLPALDKGFFFSLSLPAGAVLVDEVLRATLDLSSLTPWLPPLPPPEPKLRVLERPGQPLPEGGNLWCVAAVTHHERIRGWNAAHGLPRQDEWAVNRGAVYGYFFEGDGAARSALKERLARLEREGVGARRNEGFGRVVVSDDFHRRFYQQETEGDSA